MGTGAGLTSGAKLASPIFVALDVDDDAKALDLAVKLRPFVGGFKVGPRLTYKYGSTFVKKLSQIGLVFVDNKYHDIPNTVLTALRATFESGATFTTVHASNGPHALKEMAKLEAELNRERPFRIFSVTVLTSFDDQNLPSNWQRERALHHVELLARDTIAAGLSGIVCSPEEVSHLREKFPQAYLVTPGIRLPTDSKGDQSRVMGPAEALRAGASALVVGRPIVDAPDPVAAAQTWCQILGR